MTNTRVSSLGSTLRFTLRPTGSVATAAGRPRSLRGPGHRPGASIVEATLVLPLLLSIVFGAVEFGVILHARHSMTNAARDAARMLAVQGTTIDEAAEAALASLPGDPADYEFTATLPASEDERDVRVEITVPLCDLGLGCLGNITGETMAVAVVMRSER